GRDVPGPEHAVAEVGGQREAVGDDGDRLGRGQGAAGRLQLGAPVDGDAVPQLAEDGDHTADLVDAVGHGRQVEGTADLIHPARDDVDLGLGRLGQRQHHGVEAPAQGAGQIVDAAVTVVGGGDQVEAADRLDLLAQLRYRQRLLGQDRDERVLHIGGD